MQLIPEIVLCLTKIIRTSNIDSGIRALGFDSLRKTLIKQDHIRDESIGKDLVKIVKFGLADKSSLVQMRAAQVYFTALYQADNTVVGSSLSYIVFHHFLRRAGEHQGCFVAGNGFDI
jgi:hypothetical protein